MRNAPAELPCKTVEAAAELMQLAIEDSETVERLMADLAAGMARESVAVEESLATARTPAEAAGVRAQYVRRIAALMVDGANRLADIGGATRTRFSRLLTERLASGSHEQLDAYQAFFKVLPGQSSDAAELMQHAWSRSDRALDEALRLAMPRASAIGAPPAPPPSALSPSAASSP